MMKRMGIVLVLLGVLVLGYGQLHRRDAGAMPRAERPAPVVGAQRASLLSPIAASIFIVGGLVMLAFPRRRTVRAR